MSLGHTLFNSLDRETRLESLRWICFALSRSRVWRPVKCFARMENEMNATLANARYDPCALEWFGKAVSREVMDKQRAENDYVRRCMFEYGRLVHRLSKSGTVEIMRWRVLPFDKRYLARVVEWYRAWCNMARAAAMEWLLVARQLAVNKDVARLVAQLVWARRIDADYELPAAVATNQRTCSGRGQEGGGGGARVRQQNWIFWFIGKRGAQITCPGFSS